MCHLLVSAFKRARPALAILGLLSSAAAAADAPARARTLRSPDGRLQVDVRLGERIAYDLSFKGTRLMKDATLALDVDHVVLGRQPRLAAARESQVDRELEPPVHQKRARLRERYNQLRLELRSGYAVTFRAYDD